VGQIIGYKNLILARTRKITSATSAVFKFAQGLGYLHVYPDRLGAAGGNLESQNGGDVRQLNLEPQF
jgi:hypothetical protein